MYTAPNYKLNMANELRKQLWINYTNNVEFLRYRTRAIGFFLLRLQTSWPVFNTSMQF